MGFAASKLFWAAADPAHLMLLALLAAGWLAGSARPGWRRLGRRLTLGIAGFMLAVAATPLADLLATPLEDRFAPPPQPPAALTGIILLGGAVSPPLSLARGQPALNAAAERLMVFADLARRYPDARLISSGGSGLLFNQQDTEDVASAAALAMMGLDPARVIFENRSRNTRENALYSRDIARPVPGEAWGMVTSAMHMPRAMGVFRQAGWEVIPLPVDYRTRGGGDPWLRFDFTNNLVVFSMAAREWIGLAAYRLAGWSNSLFPQPAPLL